MILPYKIDIGVRFWGAGGARVQQELAKPALDGGSISDSVDCIPLTIDCDTQGIEIEPRSSHLRNVTELDPGTVKDQLVGADLPYVAADAPLLINIDHSRFPNFNCIQRGICLQSEER